MVEDTFLRTPTLTPSTHDCLLCVTFINLAFYLILSAHVDPRRRKKKKERQRIRGSVDAALFLNTFKSNKFEGKGAMRYGNGDVVEGTWASGKLNGMANYSYATGKTTTVNYVNGVKQGM